MERFKRTLLQMLRTLADKEKERWKEHLPQVVHAYNCTRHESTGYSPFYLLYGWNPHLPADLIFGLVEKTDKVTHKEYADHCQPEWLKHIELQRSTDDNLVLGVKNGMIRKQESY